MVQQLESLSNYELKTYLELNQARLGELMERLEDKEDKHNLKIAMALNKIHNDRLK